MPIFPEPPIIPVAPPPGHAFPMFPFPVVPHSSQFYAPHPPSHYPYPSKDQYPYPAPFPNQPGAFPGLPFMHPGAHGEPRPGPSLYPNTGQEQYLAHPPPDAGRLFGCGTSGPRAPSPRSFSPNSDDKQETRGPYTSAETPQGPVPTPKFVREGADLFYSKSLVEAPAREGFGRGVQPKEYVPMRPHPVVLDPPTDRTREKGKQKAQQEEPTPYEPAFIKRNAAIAKKGNKPILVPVPIDGDQETWQKERQVWQREEHALSMFGLARMFVPARYKGKAVRYWLNEPVGVLTWDVTQPPTSATYLSRKGQTKSLGVPGKLNALILDPPEHTMLLAYRYTLPNGSPSPPHVIRIGGAKSGVSYADVMWGVHKYFLSDSPDEPGKPRATRLGTRSLFAGIVSDDQVLGDMLGSAYWNMPNTWLLLLKERDEVRS